MARIALKVDVDTLRGTREGVPALLAMLARVRAEATFLFSLGPDHTGWALRRVFRPGFLQKVSRTSVVSNYGLRTLMYGVLLPGPDIGRKGAAEMRAARAAGHECGIHTWDHVYWQDNVRERDAAWTRRQMQSAFDRYVEIFGDAPPTHGAAGWQMNNEAFRQIDDWGMVYASDGRGTGPYIPTVDGVACRHVQMPTTLPTLDELIGVDDLTEDNVHEAVLRLSEGERDHVFTLHTELGCDRGKKRRADPAAVGT
ncbi:polysaccharide deacetylase [Cupriavidus basilensis OR16]|uniref:Polysaccharide deacetylase n=1 Tax=Cupriavidus basilensis OR16 TaxID=1127483 RepID=H1SB75_9BURK|nr:polysaccharide deacetylase family protein [Cupriavidus basilensis]EHP40223.1 polysaccharide deacetylase [Cupriavidus basilensis OR16]